ncbi:TetR/AcrR family transcriptional regulator [Streptomyces paludis]|uniref:TetR/AcrR family transcriptional regulator n=1 Tax=Streptomyces paludis TaxID=2282738 RepID=A0A345I2B0_9ACTN|nr:TetR/AcrR family transcriptional regulator [Streptomyces paludis]
MVRAAATEFDRDGYDGTSLAKISKSAGISMGALTFHFSSKNELAETVQNEGRALTRAALERVTAQPAPALQAAVNITLELTRLVEEEAIVRSAVRLVRERPDSDLWSDLWVPAVRRLLDHAYAQGQLRGDAEPADVAVLAEHLTAGAEAYLRTRLGTGAEFESATAQLERVWRLALAGISSPGRGQRTPPEDASGSTG